MRNSTEGQPLARLSTGAGTARSLSFRARPPFSGWWVRDVCVPYAVEGRNLLLLRRGAACCALRCSASILPAVFLAFVAAAFQAGAFVLDLSGAPSFACIAWSRRVGNCALEGQTFRAVCVRAVCGPDDPAGRCSISGSSDINLRRQTSTHALVLSQQVLALGALFRARHVPSSHLAR